MNVLRLYFLVVAVAVRVRAGGANFQNRFNSDLVCLYQFTEGQTTPDVTATADASNSTFSPGSLQFGSTASWIPDSIGVRLAARAPGQSPGVGLTSTLTLANWTLHMRALQTQSPVVNSEFTVELWLRSSNPNPHINCIFCGPFVQNPGNRVLFGFRDWSARFATPGREELSYGMKLEDLFNMQWSMTDVNATGRLDAGGSYNISLRNSSSLVMVTLSYCKRVNASVNFGDCFANEKVEWTFTNTTTNTSTNYSITYINSTKMAYCLTIRSSGMNFTFCTTSFTGFVRIPNLFIDYRAWSLSNKLQFAPFYGSNASNQPHSWAGDIFLAAVYARSLNGSMQERNYAAGLPNSRPGVASTAHMSALEDIMNASTLFAMTGYDFDNDPLSFDIVQLPSVGTLYNYNGTHFLPITNVPYRITDASPLVGYLQSPVLASGRNFTSFQFSAWDGEAGSKTNCTVTVNVIAVNHFPHAFASFQTVNAQVPTSVTALTCSDPDAPVGDYIAQFCLTSTPQFGAFTGITADTNSSSSNPVPITSFPFCFSSNATEFRLMYTSVALAANSTTNVTDDLIFHCTDKFGTQSNVSTLTLLVQNSVWAVAGTSTGPENGNMTVILAGTSNITSDFAFDIVALPAVGMLFNGNGSVIATVPTAVINASG